MAKVKETKLDAFRPQEHNHNTHSQRGMGALEASMRKHGYVSPMTAAADGEILDGSARLETVANVFGDDVIVVHHSGDKPIIMVRDDIPNATTNEARAISIAANRVAEINLTWNAAELLADMQSGIDMAGLFDQSELDALLAGMVTAEPVIDPGGDVSKADELQAKWQVALGDIWQLGKHRLACGDCTDKATVERLMGGDKAALIATDPPYGVDFSGAKYNPRAKEWAGIDGDRRQGNDLRSWLSSMWELWLRYSDKQSSFYSWAAAMEEGAAAAGAMRDSGIHIQCQIIWNKNTLVLGQADYQWKHENCWYGFLKGEKHRWFGGRAQTTVWDISKISNSDYIHPMQKPTELYAIPIRNHTSEGMICAEPFSGSGTQIIACEQLHRQCRAVEINPGYVAVALQRFFDATGVKPVLLGQ